MNLCKLRNFCVIKLSKTHSVFLQNQHPRGRDSIDEMLFVFSIFKVNHYAWENFAWNNKICQVGLNLGCGGKIVEIFCEKSKRP